MTTRGGPSSTHKTAKSITLMYNLCNEPWVKYGMIFVADRGLTVSAFTSAQLKKGNVLYLENHTHRYELCFLTEKVITEHAGSTSPPSTEEEAVNAEKSMPHISDTVKEVAVDVFRFSRCKKALPRSEMIQEGIPLPLHQLEVIENDLDWSDVLWSETGVWIRGKEYKLVRMLWLSPSGKPFFMC